ncbi:MAG: STAS domain-containing protein [Actinomycetota bacterium]|nr:STAS domain-containing protein [Actinomycetota bacterium]
MTSTLPTVMPGQAHLVLAEDHGLVWLGGDVDLALADDLTRIATQLALVRLPAVVDATSVVFADSTLINFLAHLAKQGQVTVCNPNSGLRNLLSLTGLDSKLTVVAAPDSERPA